MYIPGPSTIASALRFHYLVPHEPYSITQESPFQAFLPGILKTHHLFRTVAVLPRSVVELVSKRSGITANRMLETTTACFPLSLEALGDAADLFAGQLCVILSASEPIAEQVEAAISGFTWPVLHVTPSDSFGDLSLPELTRTRLVEYTLSFAKTARELGLDSMAEFIEDGLEGWTETSVPEVIGLEWVDHLIAIPNQLTLQSMGFEFEGVADQPFVSTENQQYWDLQERLVGKVLGLRDDLDAEAPGLGQYATHDLILAAPSILKRWKTLKGKFDGLPADSRKRVAGAVRQIRSSHTFSMKVPRETSRAFFSDPAVRAVFAIRKAELEAMTSALSVKASSTLTPVVRIPTGVNAVRGKLENLGNSLRSGAPKKPRKLSRIARSLARELADNLPPWLVNQLNEASAVKLYSDVPLEWMEVEGLPLTLQASVSRTPVTPGDLFFGEAVSPQTPLLARSDFDEVLVVRSFAEGDPVRPLVESALATIRPSLRDGWPRVSIVDVKNRDEFKSALNAFHGALMIFDGHGKQDQDTDVGILQLSAEEVTTWTLRGEARVPPICILSACDTHPWDASHATSANGFLAAGAATVWATGVPIPAQEAAVLIGRLVLRISHLVPVLLNRMVGSFRWSEIPTALQRRQYMTEALQTVGVSGLRISEEARIRIATSVGLGIERGDRTWYRTMLSELAAESGQALETVTQMCRETAYFSHALCYTQYGNPETVLCVRDLEQLTELTSEGTSA